MENKQWETKALETKFMETKLLETRLWETKQLNSGPVRTQIVTGVDPGQEMLRRTQTCLMTIGRNLRMEYCNPGGGEVGRREGGAGQEAVVENSVGNR